LIFFIPDFFLWGDLRQSACFVLRKSALVGSKNDFPGQNTVFWPR
jgi:hypothetical protein